MEASTSDLSVSSGRHRGHGYTSQQSTHENLFKHRRPGRDVRSLSGLIDPSTAMVGPDACGWSIEVTVQSLHGIAVMEQPNSTDSSLRQKQAHHNSITASVAFSGSVPNMHVLSSSVCCHTGNLMIEASSVSIDDDDDDSDHCLQSSFHQQPTSISNRLDSPYRWLKASWKQAKNRPYQPHLTVPLPGRDPRLPNRPLTTSNRHSMILKEDSSDSLNDTMSTASSSSSHEQSLEISSAGSKQTSRRPESCAVWSNTLGSAALPEIVELCVRVTHHRDDTSSTVCGVAHLVMFGHDDDRGSFVVDLPVKQQAQPNTPTCNDCDPNIVLTETAHLRLRVKVIPPSRKHSSTTLSTAASTISSSSRRSGRPCMNSDSVEDDIVVRSPYPVRRSLTDEYNQRVATGPEVRSGRRHRGAISIEIPNDAARNEGGEQRQRLFCDAWNWGRFVESLSSAVRRCDTGSTAPFRQPGANDGASLGSTIFTRDSMDL